MLYNTYIDESGNTGNNLVDSTQKYFALAAVSIPQTKEVSILSYIQVKFDSVKEIGETEIKAARWIRASKKSLILKSILEYLKGIQCDFSLVILEKRFMVCALIVDNFLDGAYNDFEDYTWCNDKEEKKKAALEGKKRFINRIQVWLSNVCKENNESEPNWLWTMAVAKIYLGTEVRVENDDKFYSYALAICLQQLNDLRENFYRQKELEESQLQTKTAIESLKYTQKSLRISIVGLIAAIIVPILVSIVTINCCTSTIKIEGDQFQQLRTSSNVDSFKVAPNK